jgi:hypothetical protein
VIRGLIGATLRKLLKACDSEENCVNVQVQESRFVFRRLVVCVCVCVCVAILVCVDGDNCAPNKMMDKA